MLKKHELCFILINRLCLLGKTGFKPGYVLNADLYNISRTVINVFIAFCWNGALNVALCLCDLCINMCTCT